MHASLAILIASALPSLALQGKTTRYWDCCKPSSAWPGKTSLTSPLKICNKGGQVISDQNAQSGCNGGSSFMCSNDGPIAISDTLAYGTAAVALSGQSESQTACSCYRLTFTSGPIVGKQMIVQAINTGGDLGGNQFDLAIPGGGQGIFSGCTAQYGVSSSVFGAQYGGVSSDSQCNQLPEPMRAGCHFRFGWMKGADNPNIDFEKVACPAALVARTGCLRSGERTSSDGMTTANSSKLITSTRTSSTKAAGSTGSSRSASLYGQCGGLNWTGPTKCSAGTCKKQNDWYSQCLN